MKTSYQGRSFLAREEGCVLSAYKDSVGVYTIGIGHTSMAGPPAVTSNLRLSLAECFALFEKDLYKYEKRVNEAIKVPVSQAQYDAAVSFDYNTGAIHKASWVDKLNAGDANGAATAMLLWSKPPEIIGRRKREQHLFATGDYGNITTIPVWERRGGRATAERLPNPTGSVSPPPDVPATQPTKPPVPPSQPVHDDEGDIYPPTQDSFLTMIIKAILAYLPKRGAA